MTAQRKVCIKTGEGLENVVGLPRAERSARGEPQTIDDIFSVPINPLGDALTASSAHTTALPVLSEVALRHLQGPAGHSTGPRDPAVQRAQVDLFRFYAKARQSAHQAPGPRTFEMLTRQAWTAGMSEVLKFARDFELVPHIVSRGEFEQMFYFAADKGRTLDFAQFKTFLYNVARIGFSRAPFNMPLHECFPALCLYVADDYRARVSPFGQAVPPARELAAVRLLPRGRLASAVSKVGRPREANAPAPALRDSHGDLHTHRHHNINNNIHTHNINRYTDEVDEEEPSHFLDNIEPEASAHQRWHGFAHQAVHSPVDAHVMLPAPDSHSMLSPPQQAPAAAPLEVTKDALERDFELHGPGSDYFHNNHHEDEQDQFLQEADAASESAQ